MNCAFPADHYITKPEKFRGILQAGVEVAEAGPNLVTIGITPHRPETGYGYIQMNEKPSFDGTNPVHEVKTFAEKTGSQNRCQLFGIG